MLSDEQMYPKKTCFLLNPSLPRSSKYLVTRCLDPLKVFEKEVFVVPNTDPHKVFGRLEEGIKIGLYHIS